MRRYVACGSGHAFGVEAETALAERLPCPDPSHDIRRDVIEMPIFAEAGSWSDGPIADRTAYTVALFRRNMWWADKRGVLVWGWDRVA